MSSRNVPSTVFEADLILRDGSIVHVREARPADAPALRDFFAALDPTSRAFRFPNGPVDFESEAQQETVVGDNLLLSLVALTGPDDRIVGQAIARRRADNPHAAEIVFATADDYQGRGLGTLLLGHLAAFASERGISRFEAAVLPDNHQMIEVFRASGFPIEVQSEPGLVRVSLPTALTPAAATRFEERERRAAAAALQAIFAPRSIAVIGASRKRGTVGGEIFHNLLAAEFAGPVYPVNPGASVVQSVIAYPTVAGIPGPVDLAVVAVPGPRVLAALEDCARQGVRSLVVISAGFSEAGEGGRARQAELLRICRRSGMRLIGPNCLGITNTDPDVRLNAIFSPITVPAGRLGFASQSGALGLAAVDYGASRGLGISTFASLGNKADISSNDLLSYWETDPRTDIILLYLESFGNPRKFARIARRVARQKPIIAVKSGRSTAGARAASSHTGALLAASDVTVDALFHQAGVIRTETFSELFDVAALLSDQPLPAGNRLAIVTNVGGPAILCADTAEAVGLELPVLSEATQAQLRAFLPAEAAVSNPVDLIATAGPSEFLQAIQTVGEDPSIDAVIVIAISPLGIPPEVLAWAIVGGAASLAGRKPVQTVFMSRQGIPNVFRETESRVPAYAFPEAAAIALAHAVRYAAWRRQPLIAAPLFPERQRDEAAAIVARGLDRVDGWLEPDEVAALLGCYGLPLADQRRAATPDEAATAAAELGVPIALKAILPGLIHKTEAGAVRLNLPDGEAVRSAAQEMNDRLSGGGRVPAFLVQRMVPCGIEMIAGVVHDRQFGPIVACGAGGTLVELLKDVAVRLTPLTEADAAEMVRGLKTFPLLKGFRGAPPGDVPALEDILLRLGALADDLPEVAELDCNPVVVLERGAVIVDARVRVAPAERPGPAQARS